MQLDNHYRHEQRQKAHNADNNLSRICGFGWEESSGFALRNASPMRRPIRRRDDPSHTSSKSSPSTLNPHHTAPYPPRTAHHSIRTATSSPARPHRHRAQLAICAPSSISTRTAHRFTRTAHRVTCTAHRCARTARFPRAPGDRCTRTGHHSRRTTHRYRRTTRNSPAQVTNTRARLADSLFQPPEPARPHNRLRREAGFIPPGGDLRRRARHSSLHNEMSSLLLQPH